MRIAYISLHWPRTRDSGVGKKILRQLSLWQAYGHEARLFMHTSEYEPRSDLIEGEILSYAERGKLWTEWERIRAARQLVRAVDAFHHDLIYFRYGMYVFPIHRLAQVAPVVEDINTNDVTQHKEWGTVLDSYNRLTRGLMLRRVSGLVCVSRELSRSPAFSVFGKPTATIANGIDLDKFQPLPAPSNATPRLVFMGSPGHLWHGVDKLAALADHCPELHIDVIGYDPPAEDNSLYSKQNIMFHGYLTREKYKNILARADAAISSLALHRVGLEEASPLKSREYLACGLPAVLPYMDTDLDDLDSDFILRIPNREDNIQTHAQSIRDFAYRMRGCRADREVLVSRIDSKSKEMTRLAFFTEILGRSA